MPVEAILISNTGSYVEVAEAEELAATFPGLPAWAAAAPAARAAALNKASTDIDSAMPYQGRPDEEEQPRQFPRVAYESTSLPRAGASGDAAVGRVVWDWDFTTNAAVIPLDVK